MQLYLVYTIGTYVRPWKFIIKLPNPTFWVPEHFSRSGLGIYAVKLYILFYNL